MNQFHGRVAIAGDIHRVSGALQTAREKILNTLFVLNDEYPHRLRPGASLAPTYTPITTIKTLRGGLEHLQTGSADSTKASTGFADKAFVEADKSLVEADRLLSKWIR
jgi:hypothetical protein